MESGSVTVRSRKPGPALVIEQLALGPGTIVRDDLSVDQSKYRVTLDLAVKNVGTAPTTGPIEIVIAPALPPDGFVHVSPNGPGGGWTAEGSGASRIFRFRSEQILPPLSSPPADNQILRPLPLTLEIQIVRGTHRFLATVRGGGSNDAQDSDQLLIDPRFVNPNEGEAPVIIRGRRNP
jgi:hypothetical protein